MSYSARVQEEWNGLPVSEKRKGSDNYGIFVLKCLCVVILQRDSGTPVLTRCTLRCWVWKPVLEKAAWCELHCLRWLKSQCQPLYCILEIRVLISAPVIAGTVHLLVVCKTQAPRSFWLLSRATVNSRETACSSLGPTPEVPLCFKPPLSGRAVILGAYLMRSDLFSVLA